MNIDVVPLPRDLRPGQLADHVCAVFDVLRATTTITAALASGVRAIHLFADLQSARAAAAEHPEERVLCGEEACLRPADFDLGNSPGQFTSSHRNATLFMCTTNGTRALLAAREAHQIIPATLVNARAVAAVLKQSGRDVTLLCAGTNRQIASEDLIGAGAVINELGVGDLTAAARDAHERFLASSHDLVRALRDTPGGQNIIAARLEPDIDFAARLSVFDVVGVAAGDPLIVTRLT